jgi:prolyl oligopeptidase
MGKKLSYPDARRSNQIDMYHGQIVADPYRWLEDIDAPETQAWIAAEAALTEDFLSRIPQRDAIRDRLTQLWNYERFGTPTRVGERYVYARNTGLQNQSVIYTAETLGGPERVLIDPNTLSDDGTHALSGTSFSVDGRFMAYALSESGSDWMRWRVRDVATGNDFADEVHWSKFSGASWAHDGSGFYYSRYTEPDAATQFKSENRDHRIYFHRLGTEQAADVLVYERPDQPDWTLHALVTEDGRWLMIEASEGTSPNNLLFVADLLQAELRVEPLFVAGDAAYEYIGNDDECFYFRTTKDATRGRIVSRTLSDPQLTEIVSEQPDALEGVTLFGDVLILTYLRDAHAVVRRWHLRTGHQGWIDLPGVGSVAGFTGRRSDAQTFLSFTSYTTPTSIFRLDPSNGVLTLVFAPRVPFDSERFESRQMFATSRDGTRIPVIVSSLRGLERNGETPTILYGYGGFGISLTPGFSPATLAWLEMGGAFAVANLRGGGEYGEAWHEAGTKERKQNVFDDCIAVAEFLISEGYTSSRRLALYGGSNGGLLVGAVMTQRPDLIAAAIPAVGVLDMLRFQNFTIGWAWTADYGSSDDPDAFPYLYAYSPLHQVREGTTYPATLVVTADHDDRVFPAHSFKFAAALQAAHNGTQPVLIRIETKAGHGAGKPTSKVIDEATDRYAFLVAALDFHPHLA